MVSDDEAKSLLREAHNFVNGDPDDRIQEFFVARVDEKEVEEGDGTITQETELDVGEIPFHAHIITELLSMYIEELYKEVASVVKKEEKPISTYEVGNIEKTPSPLQYMPVDDLPDYNIFKPFTNKDGFSETDFQSFESPDFQALRVRDGLNQNTFVAFRKFTRRQIVGSSWKVKLLLRENEYDQFNDNLYALPESFDAFVFNGTMFVKNQGAFEDIFKYFVEYRQKANEVFDALDDGEITIHNLGEFESAVNGDRSALRKMVEVERRGLYQELERDQVQTVIDEFDLDVDVATVDDEWGLIMPSKGDKKDLISLLNDDHLYSQITENRYQARGKIPR
ncbi:DUF4868 domain-containing protein [Haloarcula taiwanensis]|uniref:DUF4868 domain-containing protein n=2 Tax=Haloarcula TaxID=2237 RepID=M0JZE2_9EURY|nr:MULTISPECIES: Kiwa anti-phage protein KwaB-like domain-containing protein [Haloarcula]AUG46428.1 DUF4868 domain-containing protein [Haloarcula taiwanensis]EMA12950.1 hypothetical protein C436_14405 [Haloarcula sinaiiensis ATCC 33800]QUJ71259.1 DUF4868 domain-containing protein [Haloarcula sinaiiensis ATCC 33800]